jgi:UrcA family protein
MSKLVLAAVAAFALAGPAFAQESLYAQSIDRDLPTQVVSTRGVNFQDHASVQHFYSRLWTASYSVCNTSGGKLVLSSIDATCVRNAMDQAVKAVNQRTLTAMNETRPANLFASR